MGNLERSSQKVLKTVFRSEAQSCQSRLIQLVWRIHNTRTQTHTALSGATKTEYKTLEYKTT